MIYGINLLLILSGSLESGVLESGLLIKDIHYEKSMLEVSNEEEWIPTELVNDTDKMYSDLGKIKRTKFSLEQLKSKLQR